MLSEVGTRQLDKWVWTSGAGSGLEIKIWELSAYRSLEEFTKGVSLDRKRWSLQPSNEKRQGRTRARERDGNQHI